MIRRLKVHLADAVWPGLGIDPKEKIVGSANADRNLVLRRV